MIEILDIIFKISAIIVMFAFSFIIIVGGIILIKIFFNEEEEDNGYSKMDDRDGDGSFIP